MGSRVGHHSKCPHSLRLYLGLKIPAGTVAGRKMRLKGKGIPGAEPGDLFVVPTITPTSSGYRCT